MNSPRFTLKPLLLAALVLSAFGIKATAIPSRFPNPAKSNPGHENQIRPGSPIPGVAVKQRLFGIGVGFETSGTLTGVPLKIVLPGSPAARAGLVTGCVVAEINGESTIGRPGDDCARLIREALGTVRIKYVDPALKERTLTLEKEWLTVPD